MTSKKSAPQPQIHKDNTPEKTVKIKGKNEKYMLKIGAGKPLVASITEYVTDMGLKGGFISGIGLISEPEIGFFEIDKLDFKRKVLPGQALELVSLQGNISLRDGKPYIHVHCCVADSNFKVWGGHLFEANVKEFVEVFITPLGVMPLRQFDPFTKMYRICGIVSGKSAQGASTRGKN